MNLDETLRDKQVTNGPFEQTSELAQSFKFLMRRGPNWDDLPMDSKEALELIASHLAKILHGDHLQPKHWNDIATLARIRGKALDVDVEEQLKTLYPLHAIKPEMRSVIVEDEGLEA